MTKIEIFMDREGLYRQIICMGHAEFARKRFFHREPDILCAAVSVLVIGTMNSLEELAGEQFEMKTNEETGFIRCVFSSEKPLQEKSVFLLDSMVYNLEKLSGKYGEQYLQIEFKEV